MDESVLREVVAPNQSKIVLMVLDGLGGLPHPETRRTELETADIPHLDRLAAESACGLTIPVAPGVTPGRPRSPGAVRLRPRALEHRARRARSGGDRVPARAERRGGAGQFLHGRRRRPDYRSPCGAHPDGTLRRAVQYAARDRAAGRGGPDRAGARTPLRAGAARRRPLR